MSSIADHMPRMRRTQPKHRAVDRVGYLQHQVDALEDLAGRQAAQLAGADAHIEQRDNDLRHTASELGTWVVATFEAEARATEAERLRDAEHAELVALRARVANLDPWSIPQIGHRDTDPDDESTHPIDVHDLRARYADDYINRTPQAWQPIPLHQAPQATVPAVDDEDPTLTIRFPAAGIRVTATGNAFATA